MLQKASDFKKMYSNIKTPLLQELLWFHRIKNDQDKKLLTLEFLNVCSAFSKKSLLFDQEYLEIEDKIYNNYLKVSYEQEIQVRNILYNFPELELIYRSQSSQNKKWDKVEEILRKKIDDEYNYIYLRERFDRFDTFYKTVTLLRKASLGLNTKRRWTSKFLYPFSFNTLFPDLDNRKGTFSVDRRFFSRGGEVLYLMISRGKNASKLKTIIEKIYQDNEENARWNALFQILKDNDQIHQSTKDSFLGFLRIEKHKIFDNLVDDLIALLENKMPNNDYFHHVANIVAFYLVHFILVVSAEILQESLVEGETDKIVYPVEILSSKSDHVRRASRSIYKINEELPLEALEKTLQECLDHIYSLEDKEQQKEKLEELNFIDIPDNEIDDYELPDKTTLYKNTYREVAIKFSRELKPIHRVLFKDIGIASAKQTNSYRYIANDDFFKTLILVNVKDKKNFDDFIELLYEKYGFILTKDHSSLLKEAYSQNDFVKNKDRFFEKLRSIGLLENKSDGYTYVINNYSKRVAL